MRLSLSFLVFVFTAFITRVEAAPAFVACTSSLPAGGNPIGTLLGLTGTTLTEFLFGLDATSCGTQCAAIGPQYVYSYYQPGVVNVLLPTCECGTASQPPTTTIIAAGTDAAGTCSSSEYTTMLLQTGETFNGCFSASLLTGLDIASTTSAINPSVCATTCVNSATMIITPLGTGLFDCVCAAGYSGATAANGENCNVGVSLLYTQPIINPSGGARRRRNEPSQIVFDNQQKIDDHYCPKGFSACSIPGSNTAFECIDPQNELESCGGCVSGHYNNTATSNPASGVDCTSLPGVAFDGVICSLGVCKIYSCRAGYVLHDGQCLRNSKTGGARRGIAISA